MAAYIAPLTPAERFERAKAAQSEAWRIAKSITADTPGRERAGLITRTRTAYNAAHSAVAVYRRPKRRDTAETVQLRQQAEYLIEDCHQAVQHARRFSE